VDHRPEQVRAAYEEMNSVATIDISILEIEMPNACLCARGRPLIDLDEGDHVGTAGRIFAVNIH